MQICSFFLWKLRAIVMQTQFSNVCVYACGKTNELLRFPSGTFHSFSPSTRLNFDFAMKISTPDKFGMQIKFHRIVQKTFCFPWFYRAGFCTKKPIMQSELREENSLRFPFITFFVQLIVPMEALPKTNWILRVHRHSHEHTLTSLPIY